VCVCFFMLQFSLRTMSGVVFMGFRAVSVAFEPLIWGFWLENNKSFGTSLIQNGWFLVCAVDYDDPQ
jgi:hypothetical protein